ncbi:MAG: DUF3168 domain-containing protein [Sideroxyarcus sp.]|nr:DUF3168 domain-containing protein [Sideroxyarcus sp.]
MDVKAISYLLRNNANLVAAVPAAKIFSGVIPLNTVLPAIVIRHIDDVELKMVKTAGVPKLITARVQVTVQALSYSSQKAVLELIRLALVSTRSTVNGVAVDSISSEGSGPDLWDQDASIYEQSRDFFIRWSVSA